MTRPDATRMQMERIRELLADPDVSDALRVRVERWLDGYTPTVEEARQTLVHLGGEIADARRARRRN